LHHFSFEIGCRLGSIDRHPEQAANPSTEGKNPRLKPRRPAAFLCAAFAFAAVGQTCLAAPPDAASVPLAAPRTPADVFVVDFAINPNIIELESGARSLLLRQFNRDDPNATRRELAREK